jgi:SAM-dependent methyltransferase
VNDEAARLAGAWKQALSDWAIPAAILDAAPESPYGFPSELFVRRAEAAHERTGDPTPTTARGLDARGSGGPVLDVGAGGGATSLPLAARCTGLIAVDGQPDMLDAVDRRAAELGIPITTVAGRWPDIAPRTPHADVAVCGHVAYNAPDLGQFVTQLSSHAGRRVVMELTERHPLWWMNDLWLRFHELERPERPTAEDALALCRALGFDAQPEDRVDTARAGAGFATRQQAIDLVRRRLCLTPDADHEIADALGPRLREAAGLWHAGPAEQTVVTLWWDTAATAGP